MDLDEDLITRRTIHVSEHDGPGECIRISFSSITSKSGMSIYSEVLTLKQAEWLSHQLEAMLQDMDITQAKRSEASG